MREFVADAFTQVENRLKAGQKDQIKLCTKTKDLISMEQGSLKAIHEEISSGAAVVRDHGDILLELQKKLSELVGYFPLLITNLMMRQWSLCEGSVLNVPNAMPNYGTE